MLWGAAREDEYKICCFSPVYHIHYPPTTSVTATLFPSLPLPDRPFVAASLDHTLDSTPQPLTARALHHPTRGPTFLKYGWRRTNVG